ncbi:hypothetical protein SCLCIDRAFT_30073 [Scleroderma citrinum Foug A]|uniref:Uncharacterized protein n=1 Tax=Scleroderma citrinum Foug A TaxID=1036808 RepID=A0A0C2ZTD4_9AGAM|nr:hypothetical protein SCLCIDRAFT_30073 [Scleroderma citrinum Foug A]
MTKLKSVTVGIRWRGWWDVVGFSRDEGKLEIQVEKDVMVDGCELVKLELCDLGSEPLGKSDFVIVEVGSLEDIEDPLTLLCVHQQAAATDITDPLGVLAGWQPDDGSYDWECLDAILKWTFYTLVPITILRPIQKLNTAHEIFNYLAKRFCNNNPITDPCTKKSESSTNKVDGAGTATEDISADLEKWKGSPTSKSAAAETLASANRDNNEDLSTKALTRGTQDVNDGNVGRTQDLCTSLEASAQGTSTKCAETTPVVLKSALLHETQTELHSSLLLTPRPPIEGEPNRCKQEAVDSVVMAGCTKGMVKTAKPTEIADVDRTALLGGKLAERACGVDEGNGTERKDLWLPKAELYCEDKHQHNENASENLPSTYKLPLKGEWTGYASGEARDTEGDANASDAATERVDCPCESRVTADTNGVESEGRREGMSGSASVDEADGSIGRGVEPAGMPNELEDPDGGGIPCVCLGGMQMWPGDMDGPGHRTDMSWNQADDPRVWTDTLNMSDRAETDGISHRDDTGTYLTTQGMKHDVREMDGIRSHVDASNGLTDTPSVNTDTIKAANGTGNVRTRRTEEKTQNSPTTPKNTMPKPADQWRKVSAEEINVYVPWDVPVEALGQTFEFGQVEGGDEAIAPRNVEETAEDGNGNQNGDGGDDGGDGSVDGTTSGGGVHSTQVKTALLTTESQHMRQN